MQNKGMQEMEDLKENLEWRKQEQEQIETELAETRHRLVKTELECERLREEIIRLNGIIDENEKLKAKIKRLLA